MDPRFPNLLSPVRIGGMTVRNRLVSSAHATRLIEGHRPTKELAAYQAVRAKGGIGLIILEATRVHPSTRPDTSTMIGWDESMIPLFRMVADAVHVHGAKIVVQLIHQGRAANSQDTGQPLWSASQVPANKNPEMTHAMSKDEIAEVIQWWGRCAANMKKAGMDGVEIHGAHGYLVTQFLSPFHNKRTDEYGGGLKNRARFALELAEGVRKAVGRNFVVGMRFTGAEFVPGGLGLEDTSQVARWLEEAGQLDFLNIAPGTQAPGLVHSEIIPDMSWSQGAFAYLAEGIKKATKGIPIMTVGRIVDPVVAENIIASGKADLVCMTRAHIADPEIGRKLMEGRPEDIRACIGCNHVLERVAGRTIACLVNVEAGREHLLGEITRAPKKKAVLVVGGGLAGMEAARVAAERGHRVTLYESSDQLGGQVRTLTKAPHRQEFGNIAAWLEYQLKKLRVVVKLNTEATTQRVRDEEPDAVIVATGSVPEQPEIPNRGSSPIPAASGDDVLNGKVPVGKKVIVVDSDGHHKGISTAEYIADRGASVCVVTRSEKVAYDVTPVNRGPVINRLKAKGAAFYPNSAIKAVHGSSVTLQDLLNGEDRTLEKVDLIVFAGRNRARTELFDQLKEAHAAAELFAVGDCAVPRRAVEAIREGHIVARSL